MRTSLTTLRLVTAFYHHHIEGKGGSADTMEGLFVWCKLLSEFCEDFLTTPPAAPEVVVSRASRFAARFIFDHMKGAKTLTRNHWQFELMILLTDCYDQRPQPAVSDELIPLALCNN